MSYSPSATLAAALFTSSLPTLVEAGRKLSFTPLREEVGYAVNPSCGTDPKQHREICLPRVLLAETVRGRFLSLRSRKGMGADCASSFLWNP